MRSPAGRFPRRGLDAEIAKVDNSTTVITTEAIWAVQTADTTVNLPTAPSSAGYTVEKPSTTKWNKGDKIEFTVRAKAGYKLADKLTFNKEISRTDYSLEEGWATFTYTVGEEKTQTLSITNTEIATPIEVTFEINLNAATNETIKSKATATASEQTITSLTASAQKYNNLTALSMPYSMTKTNGSNTYKFDHWKLEVARRAPPLPALPSAPAT